MARPAHHIASYRQAMTEVHARRGSSGEARRYEIRLQGRLDARWATWFDAATLTTESDGTTVLRAQVADQAALHGLLQKVRDMGLPLISLTHLDPEGT